MLVRRKFETRVYMSAELSGAYHWDILKPLLYATPILPTRNETTRVIRNGSPSASPRSYSNIAGCSTDLSEAAEKSNKFVGGLSREETVSSGLSAFVKGAARNFKTHLFGGRAGLLHQRPAVCT